VTDRLQHLANEDITAYVADRFAQSERNVGEDPNPLLDAAKPSTSMPNACLCSLEG
jgi:hypothetical protein